MRKRLLADPHSSGVDLPAEDYPLLRDDRRRGPVDAHRSRRARLDDAALDRALPPSAASSAAATPSGCRNPDDGRSLHPCALTPEGLNGCSDEARPGLHGPTPRRWRRGSARIGSMSLWKGSPPSARRSTRSSLPGRTRRQRVAKMSEPGRLAQLGEHQLDKLGVTGSSPVPPTLEPAGNSGFFLSRGSQSRRHHRPRGNRMATVSPNRRLTRQRPNPPRVSDLQRPPYSSTRQVVLFTAAATPAAARARTS